MREINLLDWRREVREQKRKAFIMSLALVLIAAGAIVAGVHKYFASKIDHQLARNELLTSEIATLDRQISEIKDLRSERERLIARTDKIQDLQAGRSDIVHLIDDVATTLPSGVFYTAIRQEGEKVTMTGKAQSNARVSSLMRRLDASDWMGDPLLQEIVAERTSSAAVPRLSSFRLSVKHTRPKPASADSES